MTLSLPSTRPPAASGKRIPKSGTSWRRCLAVQKSRPNRHRELGKPTQLSVPCSTVSRALSAIDKIHIARPGSMVDFAPAFGWQAEEFQTAYRRNQAVVVDETFEADAVVVAIKDFIVPRQRSRLSASILRVDALAGHMLDIGSLAENQIVGKLGC